MNPAAFLIAESLIAAERSARIDWGWTERGAGLWRRPDGLMLHYLGSAEQARGARKGAVIFTGQGWANSPVMARGGLFHADLARRFRFLRPNAEVRA